MKAAKLKMEKAKSAQRASDNACGDSTASPMTTIKFSNHTSVEATNSDTFKKTMSFEELLDIDIT